MKATPLREFVVALNEGVTGRTERYQAHQPHVDAVGTLMLLQYDELNHVPWTVQMFAAGTWSKCSASVPTSDDIRVMQANESDARSAALQRAVFEQGAAEEMQRDPRGRRTQRN